MSTRQYIGARYVIKVYENSQNANSAEWEANTYYEPLVMVTYNNSSYLSKKDVPATVGNPVDNPDYWVITGYYNGQVAELYNAVDRLNNLNNYKLCFVKNDDNTAMRNGNCVILKTPSRVVMFDTSYNNNTQNVINSLIKMDVTKITDIVISHWHLDHANIITLNALIDGGYVDSNTKFHLALSANGFDSWNNDLENNYNSFISIITQINAIYDFPSNGTSITFDDCVIDFFNNEISDYTTIAETSSDYNDFCMISYLTCGLFRLGVMGDVNSHAQKHIYDMDWCKKCNVTTAAHHGVATYYSMFELSVAPETCVIMSSTKYISQSGNNTELSFLSAKNTEIISTNINDIYMSFNHYQYTIDRYANSFMFGSSYAPLIDLYVDTTTTNVIEDGTMLNPFSSLDGALSKAGTFHNAIITINCDNVYIDKSYTISCNDNKIIIKKLNCKSLTIINGDFEIYDSTFSNTAADIIIRYANGFIRNCTLNGNTIGNHSTGNAAINVGNCSNVNCSDNTINNKGLCYYAVNNSKIVIESMSGTNNDYIASCSNLGSEISSNISFSSMYTIAIVIPSGAKYCKGTLNGLLSHDDYLTVSGNLNIKRLDENTCLLRLNVNSISITQHETIIGNITDNALKPYTQATLPCFTNVGVATLRIYLNGDISIICDDADMANVNMLYCGATYITI